MTERIAFILKKIIKEPVDFTVEAQDRPEFGHYSTNAALRLSGKLKKVPVEVALELRERILKADRSNFFAKIEVAPAGFINFWLSRKTLLKAFSEIAQKKVFYGRRPQRKTAPIIFEYSDPNIAKRMHVGHLRATIIGDALANIFKFMGYRPIRWNYLGDWGTQFGKIIAAYKLWGNKGAVEKNPIGELQNLYVRFHEELKNNPELEELGRKEFKKLEGGNAENRKLWQWFKKESLKEFNKIYQALGVNFDLWIGESFYEKNLRPLIERLVKKGIAKPSLGSLIIPLESSNLPPAMIQKSDGTSLYLTRDIANLEYRISKYKPARIVYIVGNEQSLHFSQLFAIAKLLRFTQAELTHVKYGLVLGSHGKKLATREGKAVLLEELIQKAIKEAQAVVEEKNTALSKRAQKLIAEAVGIGALKYNDLSQNRQSDITFNWKKMLNLEGNSAPYLMYTYARLRSILRKGRRLGSLDVKHLHAPSEFDLILKLLQFPEVIEQIVSDYFPHHLADYLYDLAQRTNSFYHAEPVLKAKAGLREARLYLVRAVAETIKTGLNLLGIKTLERM